MKLKLVLFLAIISLVGAFSSSAVLAHVLVVDGSIGAVLHVDPEDNPVAGQQTHIYFEFKDTKNLFQLSNCKCSVTISEDKTTLFSKNIEATDSPSKNNLVVDYVFPKEALYTIVISGEQSSSTTTPAFKPFTLRYDIRVDKTLDGFVSTTTTAQATSTSFSLKYFFTEHGFHILIFGAAFVVGGILTLTDRNKNKVKKI